MKIRRWQSSPEPLWWLSRLSKVLDEVSIICAFYLLSLRFDSDKTHYLWKVAYTKNELEEFLILHSIFLFISSWSQIKGFICKMCMLGYTQTAL